MKVPVSVGNVFFSKKLIVIRDFVIYNPKHPHSDKPEAIRVKSIQVHSPYKNYLHDPMIIDEMTLKNVFVTIEYFNADQTESNWIFLNSRLDAPTKDKDKKKERVIKIKKLRINGLDIDQVFFNNTFKHYKLAENKKQDEIVINNINTEKGLPLQEITQAIIRKIMAKITLLKGIKTLLEIPEAIIKDIIKPFKKDEQQNSSSSS